MQRTSEGYVYRYTEPNSQNPYMTTVYHYPGGILTVHDHNVGKISRVNGRAAFWSVLVWYIILAAIVITLFV